MSQLRPKQILREIGRTWPDTWAYIKKMRGDKGKSLPDWPDWCYIPLAAGVAIATQGDSSKLLKAVFDSRLSPAVITAAAAWRVSQGIYRFDADLYNSLVSQPLDGNVPCDALQRLPEYCVYIETYGATFCDVHIVGFWAHLEHDANDGRMELRFVMMAEDGSNIPVPVHLGNWTLEEGLERMKAEAVKHTSVNVERIEDIDIAAEIESLLQLVVYLCAENADMPQIRHPNTRVRMSGQVDVAREPRLWTVGERIGAGIRKYRNQEAQEHQGGTHASPRPHVRRAHWHSFWTGPRDGKRKLILHWLPPIPVGIDTDDEGPAVIHNIK